MRSDVEHRVGVRNMITKIFCNGEIDWMECQCPTSYTPDDILRDALAALAPHLTKQGLNVFYFDAITGKWDSGTPQSIYTLIDNELNMYNANPTPRTGLVPFYDLDLDFGENNEPPSVPKCECGAEKAKSLHSRWCPKASVP